MKEENTVNPISGWIMLPALLVLMVGIVVGAIMLKQPGWLVVGFVPLIMLIGLFIVNPNESMVLVLFGKYQGTIRTDGFFWVNPFNIKRKISLRAHNFDNEPIKGER